MANATCTVKRCPNAAHCKGLCSGHYGRLRTTGDVQADVPLQKKRRGRMEKCSRAGCPETYAAKGLCKRHYMEAREARLSQEQCEADGCTNPRGGTGGYCPACYQRYLACGDPSAGPPRRKRRGEGVADHGSTPMEQSYYVNHRRVRAERGPAWQQICGHCGDQASDWATIHGRSGERPEDYTPLCRSCHHAYDGRSANLPHHEGETHPQAKLTDQVVREIRSRSVGTHLDKHLVVAYAAAFNVTPETIMNVVTHRTWKHLV